MCAGSALALAPIKKKIKARSGYTIKKTKPLKIFINVFEYFFYSICALI